MGVFIQKGEPNKHKRDICQKIIETNEKQRRRIQREGEGKRNTEQEK